MSAVFHLMCGEEILGFLRSYEADFPWLNCKFEPTPAFEPIRFLFEEQLVSVDSGDVDKMEAAFNKVEELNLILLDIDGNERIVEFLLHIDGDEAWFRY